MRLLWHVMDARTRVLAIYGMQVYQSLERARARARKRMRGLKGQKTGRGIRDNSAGERSSDVTKFGGNACAMLRCIIREQSPTTPIGGKKVIINKTSS